MNDVHIIVQTAVHPTEDESKVKHAVGNLFPLIELNSITDSCGGIRLIGEDSGTESLSEFRRLLRRQRIRAAAKSLMFRSTSEGHVTICLNKQAAFAGRISFVVDPSESPLGPITLLLECSDPQSVIDWLVESDRLIERD